jgi:hypothetical protein
MNHRVDVHTASAYNAQNQAIEIGPAGRRTASPVTTSRA